MASLKVKKVNVAPRMAYVLREAIEGHKAENLRDARNFLAVMDALSKKFNMTALTSVHKLHIKELEDARLARAEGTATDAQDAILRLTNEEWFARLHMAFDAAATTEDVEFPLDATDYVVKWLEKQSFNMLGARLMVAFCDMYEDALPAIAASAEKE